MQDSHAVLTVPWAVTSLTAPGEQCQPAVLAQPLGPWGEKPWLLSSGWEGRSLSDSADTDPNLWQGGQQAFCLPPVSCAWLW